MTQESEQTDQMTDAVDTADVAQETSSPDVTDTSGASSSDAAVEATQEQPESELTSADVIRDAFLKEYGEPDDEDDAETSEASEDKSEADAEAERDTATEAQKDGGDDEFRISDDDFKALPDSARKRIGHLNARAKKAERQVGELQASVERSQEAVQQVQALKTFIDQNNIETGNVNRMFDMAAKLSGGDFDGFLTDIQPFIDYAQQATGKALPAELQEQVDDGYVTEEVARELVKSRSAAQRAQDEAQRLQQQRQQQDQQQARTSNVNAIQSAVNQRENEIKASDPDYARISKAVRKNMEFALSNGAIPQSSEQAIQMVNQAYEMAKSSVPAAPKPSTPRRPNASMVARGGTQPASTRDAIITAMEGFAT